MAEENLPNLIAPGASRNDPSGETIGIFGVGSKRAVVALAEDICIKTRHGDGPAFQIDINNDWLESPEWEIPHYRIPAINPSTTSIRLSALRMRISDLDVDELMAHVAEVYAWFLAIDDCNVSINDILAQPREFDTWAYPDQNPPREARFTENVDGATISIEVSGGLITDRDPVSENYGVYFYCNNRLVVKNLKCREVGYFVTSEAGVPHPDASLCRVIVRINGSTKYMPWHSSKSAVRFDHPVFSALRPTLIKLVSHYSSLSRRLKDEWDAKVFACGEGEVERADSEEPDKGSRLILPPLPKVRKPASAKLKIANAEVLRDAPWTLGLLEAVSAVDSIQKLKLETRNRIALILLDSNFEIGLKEFVIHRSDLFTPKVYDDAKIKDLFSRRYKIVTEVKNKVKLPQKLVEKANHYYGLRNKLIHERATVGITDADVAIYRDTIEQILNRLFDLNFHP